MEYIICCLCSLLCFVCGVWAAGGLPEIRQNKQSDDSWCETDDTLSRDIAALLAYTGPKKEETSDEDS